MIKTPLLSVKNLTVQIDTPQGIVQPLDGVEFSMCKGEIYALVGESGCGKSMTAMSINRLLPNNAKIGENSEILFDDIALHQISEHGMRKIRANKIGMIFQDPTLSLNPVLTIGDQIAEAIIIAYPKYTAAEVTEEIISLLEKVRIENPKQCMFQYPHQLSGGMKQRIVIAMALAKKPDLLIADEPTTALDVTTQAKILELIQDLNSQMNMAILIITHDIGVVAKMANTVGVMYAGHIIEQAEAKSFLDSPKHPYSQKLLAAMPEVALNRKKLSVIPGQVPKMNVLFTLCRFKDRCASAFSACESIEPNWTNLEGNRYVRCLLYEGVKSSRETGSKGEPISDKINTKYDVRSKTDQTSLLTVDQLKVYFPIRKGIFKRTIGWVKAVDGVSFELNEGETLALVGGSGCGKTTIGKAILRLIPSAGGQVLFQNQNLLALSGRALRQKRSDFQMIFQDPFSSMDGRQRIHEILEEGMIALGIGKNADERRERTEKLLEQVGLPIEMLSRFPHELSGGQRQRIAIARSLAVGAKLIVCDEPTSALDISVQAQILNLLKSIQQEMKVSYLFITHNMGVVNYLADKVAVIYQGKIVEYGSAEQVLHAPKHPYTQALLNAVL